MSKRFIPHLSENHAVLRMGYQGKHSVISAGPNTRRKGAGFIIGIDEVGRAKSRQWRDRPLRQKVLAPSDRGSSKTIIGIDEVGRGALAGPLVLAGIATHHPFHYQKRALGPIKDSKKLTAQKRVAWLEHFRGRPEIRRAVTRICPRVIDRVNISRAASIGARRLFKKLAPARGGVFVYLDGGLEFPETIPHRTIIKGDEKIKIIAAASIVAKVARDRIMVRLHKKDPRYDFHIHKGYGTKLHRQKMRQFGYSDFHRRSFAFKAL